MRNKKIFVLKISNIFFYFINSYPWHKHAKQPPSDLTPWTLTLTLTLLKLHGSSLSYRYFKVTDGSPMVPIQKHSLISCDNLALLGTLPKRELYINHNFSVQVPFKPGFSSNVIHQQVLNWLFGQSLAVFKFWHFSSQLPH